MENNSNIRIYNKQEKYSFIVQGGRGYGKAQNRRIFIRQKNERIKTTERTEVKALMQSRYMRRIVVSSEVNVNKDKTKGMREQNSINGTINNKEIEQVTNNT